MISQAEAPRLAEPDKWSAALVALTTELLTKDDNARVSCAQALQSEFCRNAGTFFDEQFLKKTIYINNV